MTLKYCENLLTNRHPKPEFEEDFQLKSVIHEHRIEETIDEDVEYSSEVFKKSLEVLEKKGKEKYMFITKSGDAYKNALDKLFNVVWNNEIKPDS